MPSDCQCSTYSEPRTVEKVVTKTKVVGSKTATRRLAKLEEENERLKKENIRLKQRLTRRKAAKRALISELKAQLDDL